jgi:hypothetical protein
MPDEQQRLTATDVYTSSFHVGDAPQKAPLVVSRADAEPGPEPKRARLAREKAERAAERPVGVFTGSSAEEELMLQGVDPKTVETIEKARADRLEKARAAQAPKDAPKDDERVRDIPARPDEPRRSVAAPSGPKS